MNNGSSGVIIVDKPAGISSAKTVAIVKGCLRADKTGHTGTLDPFATGVLICCINQATRLSRFLLHGFKTYDATLHLGVETDTQDATGEVVSTVADALDADEDEVRRVMSGFTGRLLQTPPIYSALKHQGKPLYQLARSGRPVQKPPRQVDISNLEIMEIRLPEVRFTVCCSAGTYIRTLCSDIGRKLGCGAHLKTLRRTESGGFGIEEAVTIDELVHLSQSGAAADRLIPMAAALRRMPSVTADSDLKSRLQQGRPVSCGDFAFADPSPMPGYFAVIDEKGPLIAVMEKTEQAETCNYCCVFADNG